MTLNSWIYVRRRISKLFHKTFSLFFIIFKVICLMDPILYKNTVKVNFMYIIDTRSTINKASMSFKDRYRLFIRSKGLAYATEKTYCHWVARFIRHMGYKHENELCVDHINHFLSDLGNSRGCSINTQLFVIHSPLNCYAKEPT